MARGIDTKCIHLEEDEGQCSHYGALSYPIYQTATYAHPGVGQSTGFDYSRLQNPTREHLEKMVAALENGIDAFALSSGMAAISLLMEMFRQGDHIIADSDLYGGSIRLFHNVNEKNGVEFCRGRSGKLHQRKYKSNLHRNSDEPDDERNRHPKDGGYCKTPQPDSDCGQHLYVPVFSESARSRCGRCDSQRHEIPEWSQRYTGRLYRDEPRRYSGKTAFPDQDNRCRPCSV